MKKLVNTTIYGLTSDNAEAAIEGALLGYKGIINLDGMTENRAFKGGLFEGTAKTTINTAAKLGELVDNMIGLTLSTKYRSNINAATSNVMTPTTAIVEADTLLKNYNAQLDAEEKAVKAYFLQEKEEKAQRINDFKKVMTELNELYKTGNAQEVADVIDKINTIATWSTIVPVGQIYVSMKGMLDVAEYFSNSNMDAVSLDAQNLYGNIDEKMWQTKKTKVQEYKTFLGFKSTISSKVAPELNETYDGSIDSEKIAMDLLRFN
ncbi:hypothetical protein COV13_02835 [Candidatus Woesearchaeota archaeon CG10_big_fil_rev_8_21_14_0_10_32_9]|nr:MAG: hypothetical protein COV13_02835 [Candidatus Woesearchaeota archaeon CG10_big_fil_rev_8_21_14_0_10_32_9]